MPDLTPEELDAIEARAEAATEGPWWADWTEISGGTYEDPRYDDAGNKVWIGETCAGGSSDHANAAFIAAARSDVPALCAEVRRLRADVAVKDEALAEERAKVVAYQRQLARSVLILRSIRMDTPEDQSLSDRAIDAIAAWVPTDVLEQAESRLATPEPTEGGE